MANKMYLIYKCTVGFWPFCLSNTSSYTVLVINSKKDIYIKKNCVVTG